MVDILHRFGAEVSAHEVYDALTSIDGLRGWWTEDTEGDPSVGGVLRFRFDAGGFDMTVVELDPDTHVRWEVIDGPPEWIGTTIDWRLSQEDEFAIVMFEHQGWREAVPFMNHCSTKWATFLLSLTAYVETGKGAPAPRDLRISNWH